MTKSANDNMMITVPFSLIRSTVTASVRRSKEEEGSETSKYATGHYVMYVIPGVHIPVYLQQLTDCPANTISSAR